MKVVGPACPPVGHITLRTQTGLATVDGAGGMYDALEELKHDGFMAKSWLPGRGGREVRLWIWYRQFITRR